MKKLFTAGAILLTVTVFGQDEYETRTVNIADMGKPSKEIKTTVTAKDTIGRNIPFANGGNNFVYRSSVSVKESNQIIIGSKKDPSSINSKLYTFSLNGEKQIQRSGDTLTVLDKTVRFIVIDGVTYEVVRSTEVKKVEEFPKATIYGYPGTIQLTPGISNVWGPVFKTN